MQVAVDFTLSNGDINSPDSLHDLTEKKNQYIKAIMGIGNILQEYDTDKKYPAYGFGGKLYEKERQN